MSFSPPAASTAYCPEELSCPYTWSKYVKQRSLVQVFVARLKNRPINIVEIV